MPFHSHHPQGPNTSQHGAASGIYQAAQALGSIGAPHGNLRTATSGQTGAGTDALLPGSGNSPGFADVRGAPPSAPPAIGGLPGPGMSSMAAQSSQTYPASAMQTPRRTSTLRQPEELHITPGSSAAGHQASSQSQQQQMYNSPDTYSAGTSAPNINLQQATPQGSTFTTSQPPAAANVPGSLQPGGSGSARPALPYSANTAPTTVPTVPQINTNAQQYTLPTRSNTMNQGHSYSRSSPAGLEQKYIPFNSQTPDNKSTFAQTPSGQKYYSPSTPQGPAAHSPLDLKDIRPMGNIHFESMGESTGAGTNFVDMEKQPGNCSYLAPWGVYAYDWCKWPIHNGNSAGKMAVGSYLEDTHNFIQILDTHVTPQEVTYPGAPSHGIEYSKVAEATCSYPVTRILWEPPSSQKQSTDLLATSGDHLRLWSLPQSPAVNISNAITRSSTVNTREQPPQKLTPLALLSNSKSPEHTAPLTSLDWNTLSPKLIITSSIDTTCTIWDIPTLTAKTQLIAHDKEVFDVRFCAQSVDVFVSCGADGSVRMFDLRSLEHSTIIYEPSEKPPGDKSERGTSSSGSNRQPQQQTISTFSDLTAGFAGSPAGAAGRMSPTKAQQTMSYAPPLLRLAASPHDAHLLATFASDSNLIRILDVRQPGQALLELQGHSASLNSIEWAPNRRGMLASGADDCLVLVWDLLHSQNSATLSSNGSGADGVVAHGPPSSVAGGQQQGTVQAKGPAASWRCDFEVGNLSWAPPSPITGQGSEWVGVCGGRGIWGVKL